MALALPWVFVFASSPFRLERLAGYLLAAIGLIGCAYVATHVDPLGEQYGFLVGPWQMALALSLIAVVLEMARRAISWPMPAITIVVLAYGLFGEHVPGEFGHAGIPAALQIHHLIADHVALRKIHSKLFPRFKQQFGRWLAAMDQLARCLRCQHFR